MSSYKKLKPAVHPLAIDDIDRQVEWLENHFCSPETVDKFLDAIEKAKAKIRDNPETWCKVPGSPRIRRVQINSFRMTAFYILRKGKPPLILEFAGAGLMPRWAKRLASSRAD
jgi:hypothetical protein